MRFRLEMARIQCKVDVRTLKFEQGEVNLEQRTEMLTQKDTGYVT